MKRLLTTVSHHRNSPEGDHHDWLFEDPAGSGQLVCFRVDRPPGQWGQAGRMDLEALALHRSKYLSYQGPLGGGRGHVQPVDRGHVEVIDWQDDQATLAVAVGQFNGRVSLRRHHGAHWILVVLEAGV